MYICEELDLANVVPYNKATLKIRQNDGLVVITGKNLDSKVSKDIKNGAGKSMLWGALANLRYGAAPSSTVKNRTDMLPKKDSSISFKFRNPQGDKIQFIQEPKYYTIMVNGVDQEVKRIPNQMKKMAELFPLTEEEFYSYVYLSSIQGQVLHFQSDKPANRLKFISTIFNLDDYDRMKKYFTQMLGRIKEEQIRFDVIESKLLGVVTSLSRLKWSADNEVEYTKLNERLEKQGTKAEALNEQKNNALVKEAKYAAILKRLKRLHTLKDIVGDVDEETLKQRVKQAVAYEQYVRDKKNYVEEKAKIDARLERMGYDGNPVDVAERKTAYTTVKRDLSQSQDKYSELKERARAYTKTTTRMDEIKEEVISLGFKSPKDVIVPDNLEEDIETCGTTIRLKKLLDCDAGSNCPTCQQRVDIKSIAKSVEKAEARLKKLKRIRAASELINDHKKLSKQRGEPVDVSKLEARITKLTKQLDKLETAYHEGVRLNELLETRQSVKKPKEVKATKKNADHYREQLNALREYNSIVEDIGNVDAKKIKQSAKRISEELPAIEKELKVVREKYKELFDKKSKMEMLKGEYKILIRQRKELESELEDVKPILAKRDMYKALEKAWSPKGMKVGAGNSIAALLEANLNKYAELLFPEPFKFKAYVNDKGFFCDVHRNNGSKATDVRQLSGAESEAFKLLFMASLMLMVDSSRRTNFVVLDEPDSHMDTTFRTLYAERFLPFLRSIVPHVFVITPKDTSIYEDAEIWQIVKHKGVSKLHIGE